MYIYMHIYIYMCMCKYICVYMNIFSRRNCRLKRISVFLAMDLSANIAVFERISNERKF